MLFANSLFIAGVYNISTSRSNSCHSHKSGEHEVASGRNGWIEAIFSRFRDWDFCVNLYSHFARKHHLIICAFCWKLWPNVYNFNSAKFQNESATPDSIQSTWQEEKNVGGWVRWTYEEPIWAANKWLFESNIITMGHRKWQSALGNKPEPGHLAYGLVCSRAVTSCLCLCPLKPALGLDTDSFLFACSPS